MSKSYTTVSRDLRDFPLGSVGIALTKATLGARFGEYGEVIESMMHGQSPNLAGELFISAWRVPGRV